MSGPPREMRSSPRTAAHSAATSTSVPKTESRWPWETPLLFAGSPIKQSAVSRTRVVVSFSLFSNSANPKRRVHFSFDQRRFPIRERNGQLMDELLARE
jgi:hypothetical protein